MDRQSSSSVEWKAEMGMLSGKLLSRRRQGRKIPKPGGTISNSLLSSKGELTRVLVLFYDFRILKKL